MHERTCSVHLCIRSVAVTLTLSHGKIVRVWGDDAIEDITSNVTLGSLFKLRIELIDLVTCPIDDCALLTCSK
jgi:cell fate regulator YaaT (PSP1 superfamily)